ncbi:unnamed protein product [Tuber melanosporum]|uniref:(Perigord truffle) hypothetical protein n=1 Tax=Tuber melanosporum (strain Mel28) TaxID=656061 RepID=D5G7J5_TUBMM|nr:uncharacterized protein GSTUM_00002603001 [Tuber melanosporum]CAZ80488.1 unnamed protein product [Tuber melanosporum]
MVLVCIKNLLFPHWKPTTSHTSPPPLLPTHTKTYGTSDPSCPNPTCPLLSRNPSYECASTLTADSQGEPEPEKESAAGVIDPRVLSDLTIGLSDGLTVPFALTAGLSAFNDTKVVLYGGIAELIAGSISMGLGGWLAGRGEAEFYENTLTATKTLISTHPASIPPLLHSIFSPYNLPPESLSPIVQSLTKSPHLAPFIMQFHHKLPPPSDRTPLSSALTIAAGYFFGGFIPLLPYFFVGRGKVLLGLAWSVGVMAASLFAFGVGKTVLVGAGSEGVEARSEGGDGREWRWGKAVRGGVEMVVVGGVAAAAAMGIVQALG